MTSIERILNLLPDLYDVEVGSNIYKLLGIPASFNDDLESVNGDILNAHWVELATGVSLDYIGSLVGCVRFTGESDTFYRNRVKNQIANYIGGGTIESIKKAVAGITGLDYDDIEVNDGWLEAYHWTTFITLLMFENDVTDYFGNNNGIVTGTVSYVDGHQGKAVTDIDYTNNLVHIADSTDFDTDDFSTAIWYKPNSVSGTFMVVCKDQQPSVPNFEWYIRLNNGKVEAHVGCATTNCDVDSGTDTWDAGDELFLALTWDDSENKATLYVGKAEDLTLHEYTDTGSSGTRVKHTGHILIGADNSGGSDDVNSWYDNFLYEDSVISNFDIHMIFGSSLGMDRYGHFTVKIVNWGTEHKLPPGYESDIQAEIDKIKAAGVKCDTIALGITETQYINEDIDWDKAFIQSINETSNRYHYCDVTYTDSLNVVAPG